MSCDNLIYSPLKEEGTAPSWDKETIKYAIENESSIRRVIRAVAKSSRNIQPADIDDIYMDVLNYFYKCDDYNIDKAYERSSSDNIVSLEGYVNKCVKFCVLRYSTNIGVENHTVVHDTVINEGEELSIFDTISSNEHIDVQVDLESLCRMYTGYRYVYGVDIFQMWYIKLLSMRYNKEESKVEQMLSVLGASKNSMKLCEAADEDDGPLMNIARAITVCGLDEAIRVIRKYTYAPDRIEMALALC